jgi:hypothetical protein
VRDDIARDLGLDPSVLPSTVEAPIDVASVACGLPASALAADFRLDGRADCTGDPDRSGAESAGAAQGLALALRRSA